MRSFANLALALALGAMGCSGTPGSGGGGGSGGMTGQEFPCTEQGIRDAIALGGGPHTFDCDGPTTLTPEAGIVIDNDVILDGEGLAIDGRKTGVTIRNNRATARLRGFTITGTGADVGCKFGCAAVWNTSGTLVLTGTVVSDSEGVGIRSDSALTLIASTISGNAQDGVINDAQGAATLTNSTVSGNGVDASDDDCGVLNNGGTVTLTNCTLSGNAGEAVCNGGNANEGTAILMGTIVDGECATASGATTTSNGYNVETSGGTCGFDQPTDQVNVSADDLKLGPLQDNGGPTMTHALLTGSVAIDKIPGEGCVDAEGEALTTDQRGVTRPQGDACDVGAFELEVAP